ncbi:MBL fold metallo-hydrolase [Flagellimonas sp. HMM57]|uniref:MBL fold metallo-hydrolase n=1 Tax=unclassified Flagellimonas TaxID=2644544 RepID=UPI0013D5B18E|nr:MULTISPECIES: MBL fold metallo-hydrolase [unclassified Flagellimonas]UII76658.1 MBL fold metallo-hydrolase [Flagellimonas sp. HMM57]
MKKTVLVIAVLISFLAYGQRDWSKVEITSEKLSDNIYVLFGAGGNIGLVVGKENAYVIDDQFAPLTAKILAHIKTLTDKPVKWVLNTHWHGDHTGGNENLANQGALVIAHENVRKRMSTKQDRGGGRVVEPSPRAALPVITFNDKMTLHLDNGNTMYAMHVNDAHTDGDSYYYFPEDNVLHMGDNFFVGRYPYIDLNSGGDIDGLISNVTMALGMIDDETKIIPGHGAVASKNDLQIYQDVIAKLRERIVKARSEGNSLEQTQKMNLSKEWDATHGQGFINADRIVEFIYKSAD